MVRARRDWSRITSSASRSAAGLGSTSSSSLKARIAASGLLSSCATPETSRPTASIFWVCAIRSESTVRNSSVSSWRSSIRRRTIPKARSTIPTVSMRVLIGMIPANGVGKIRPASAVQYDAA